MSGGCSVNIQAQTTGTNVSHYRVLHSQLLLGTDVLYIPLLQEMDLESFLASGMLIGSAVLLGVGNRVLV